MECDTPLGGIGIRTKKYSASLQKKAVILGISGQDGLYLTSRLVGAGYQVIGVSRNSKVRTVRELPVLGKHGNVKLRYFDAQDSLKLNALFDECKPVEIYNLAGESSVAESFKKPMYAVNSNIKIALNCLEYIRTRSRDIKYFNACSSECFGNQGGAPASETTPFCPISPYAVGKACAY